MNNTISRSAWAIWFVAALFYGYEFALRVSPGVMSNVLMHDLGLSASMMGLMTSAFYYAYSGMQIPSGLFVDRFGAKSILLVGTILLIIATLGFALLQSETSAILCRFLMGIGAAAGFICCLKLVRNWFPSHLFGTLAGLTNAIGYFGAIAAGQPLAIFIAHTSWRHALTVIALLGIILFIAIFIVIRNEPPSTSTNHHNIKVKYKELWTQLKALMRNRLLWINALIAGLLVAPTSTFADLWGVKFLQATDHFSLSQAAFVTSLIYIGIAIGNPFFGIFSDFIRSRRIPLIIGSGLCILSTCFLLFAHHAAFIFILIAAVLFGIGQGSHVVNFAIAEENADPSITATAISFVNMMVILGAAIFQPVVGLLMDWHHLLSTLVAAGPMDYNNGDFHIALLVLPICQVIALLLSIYGLKRTY